ncbi:MAG: hypothetical protein NVS4B12_24560 [Ktedonobacteraceae bacterium]
MELTEEVKALVLNTAKELKGSACRMFMARTVQTLGEGGQRLAERKLGWNRGTKRKGMHEVESGVRCIDGFSLRGRKRSEDHLPNVLKDITAIVDGQSQADPQFRTIRLYTRMMATEVRRQLIAQKGYSEAPGDNRKVYGFGLVNWRDGWFDGRIALGRTAEMFCEQVRAAVARSKGRGRIAIVIVDLILGTIVREVDAFLLS